MLRKFDKAYYTQLGWAATWVIGIIEDLEKFRTVDYTNCFKSQEFFTRFMTFQLPGFCQCCQQPGLPVASHMPRTEEEERGGPRGGGAGERASVAAEGIARG